MGNAVDILFEECLAVDEAEKFAAFKCRVSQIVKRDTVTLNTSVYQTIENLPPDVLTLFLKIREQLDDSMHPINLIIVEFHRQFKKYIHF